MYNFVEVNKVYIVLTNIVADAYALNKSILPKSRINISIIWVVMFIVTDFNNSFFPDIKPYKWSD